MLTPRTDDGRHPAGGCRRCRGSFMQIQRVSRCPGDRRQVAMRCANCGWQAARIMDADEVGQLERDAARDRELIARDLEILARALRPELPVKLPETG